MSVRRAAKKDVNFIEELVGVVWLGWLGVRCFGLCGVDETNQLLSWGYCY